MLLLIKLQGCAKVFWQRQCRSEAGKCLPFPIDSNLRHAHFLQFAKHMKVEEQVTFLKNRKTGISVGTPARLAELIDNGKYPVTSVHLQSANHRVGALSLQNLQRLVVDASHIDQKKRGIMDMKDTMMPLARFLSRKEFAERYVDEEKPLALLFY